MTPDDIQKAGIDPAGIDPATFQIFHMDTEIPIIVSSTSGAFNPGDVIEFYAQGIDNQYTGIDVYWLYWGNSTGKRMAGVDGSITGSLLQVSTFTEQLRVEENHRQWLQTPNAPDADYWFWDKLTGPQTSQYSFDIPSPVQNSENAAITVYFQGVAGTSSANTHHTVLSFNGTAAGDDTWQGGIAYAQNAVIRQDLLKTTGNQLTIQSLSSGDLIYFNRIQINYQRNLTALNDQLVFSLDQSDPVEATITGFGNQSISIYDVSDPSNARQVVNLNIAAGQSSFSASFQHSEGKKTYLALTSNGIQSPGSMVYKEPSDLKNTTNSANYIIITEKDFMPALENLVQLRTRLGLAVKMVDIEDIYDDFNFGVFDPDAVRAFLTYAYANWSPPLPQYVLLAGDSNLDYRNYFGTGKQNIVPVYLDHTSELGLTPSDNHYGCVQGDGPVPELYIGRIPGDSSDTISHIVNKLIRYESTKYEDSKSALFVSDNDDIAFETLNDTLSSYLPGSFTADKVYTRLYSSLDKATQDVLAFVNQGMFLINFVGHGDVTRWGAEPNGGGDFILEPSDLGGLNNSNQLTFVVTLDCLNGYFSQPFQYALSEEWVKLPDAGAIACYAPSGLSQQWEHDFLSNILFSRIFAGSENRLGIIATQSKIDAYYAGVSDKILISLNLIGDPATRLAINRKPSDLVTVHSITADATMGGTISPSGETMVFDGANQSYTITPASGYTISSVKVDSASVGQVSAYTFNNIVDDHTIHAVFEQVKQSGGGGGGGGCFIMSIRQ